MARGPRFRIRTLLGAVAVLAVVLAVAANLYREQVEFPRQMMAETARAITPTGRAYPLSASVGVVGDRVQVEARCRLPSRFPDDAYVWVVGVQEVEGSGPVDRILFRKRIDEPPLRPNPGQTHLWTLRTEIRPALRPGLYRVWARVKQVPAVSGPEGLDDERVFLEMAGEGNAALLEIAPDQE